MSATATTSRSQTSDSPARAVRNGLVVAFLILWPHLPIIPETFRVTFLGNGIQAMSYTIVAASLVLLTGWVGQISLAQASFVGVGAFVTGIFVRSLGLQFPLSLPVAAGAAALVAAGLGLVALRVRGLYLAVATLIFAWMTDSFLFLQSWMLGGSGSSSIEWAPLGFEGTIPYVDFTDRKVFYYIMLVATAAVLYTLANVRDSKSGRAFFAVRGSEVAAASLGIDVTRTKMTAFAFSGFLAGVVGNLDMTHNLVASPASFGVEVSLLFLAIAVVGGLTSLGGAVASGIVFAGLAELFFRFEALAGLLEVVSAMLLAAVLLFFPRGLAGIPGGVRGWLRDRVTEAGGGQEVDVPDAVAAADVPADAADGDSSEGERTDEDLSDETVRIRRPVAAQSLGRVGRWRRRALAWLARITADPETKQELSASTAPDTLAKAIDPSAAEADSAPAGTDGAASPAAASGSVSSNGHRKRAGLSYVPGEAERPELPPREERTSVLAARNITVTFGGLTAVDDATLEVREGEIVGLIGPNGAGKTTLFNAIAGLNEPDTGRVEMFGRDVSGLDVHERAALGVGRTFQRIQLFPQLDVFDNLLVATHIRNDTGFFSHLAVTNGAIEAEMKATERVEAVVDLLGISEHLDRKVTELPFGVLRMIEVARALVTGSPLIMLDEPASGLDNTETDKLADLLFWIREKLDVSLLLIEHDVRMVTGVSDYMYVLNRGAIIGQGTAQEVQDDQAVVDAYLGTGGDATEDPADPDETTELQPAGVDA